MLIGTDLDQYVNKIIYLKTPSNMYIKIDNILENNSTPQFVLTPIKSHATEFIFIKKSEINIIIRVNLDIKNQNGTFGYHLYVIPENDIVYGSGNDELYAQFNIFRHDQYISIKSAYKESYICHNYNVIRCQQFNESSFFIPEEVHLPFIQRSICIITYGYIRNSIDLNNSPIIKTLKEIYPQSTIDLYIFTPETMDEFYNVSYDMNSIHSQKCSVTTITHQFDPKHFMKISQSYGLPIVSNKNRIFTYRTMSMLWNISESIRSFISTKKVYNIYILMRNDMFNHTQIFKKLIDNNKLYCLNENKLDSHLMIGKDILSLNYLYDFYVHNKNTYIGLPPENIIFDFLKNKNIQMGQINFVSPYVEYPTNKKKFEDAFCKQIYSKYGEISKK